MVVAGQDTPSTSGSRARRVRILSRTATTGLTSPTNSRHDPGLMPATFPLQLLLVTFASWTNRHQAQVIEYLVEENRVLKE